MIRCGFIIPAGSPREVVELARDADAAGWDGAYWDGICVPGVAEIYNPWVVMAAMAMRTEKVRIGAILTPPSRRRPWKLAREAMALDPLSGGRMVLPVGLGALDDLGFGNVGEPTERPTRAELLDESLEIITGLWTGEPFSYSGTHYRFKEMRVVPPPVQRPRIRIWVVGAWRSERSMRRVVKYDGLIPTSAPRDGDRARITPKAIREMAVFVAERRTLETPFDIIWEGQTPGDDPAKASIIVRRWANAGVTWWLESRWNLMDDLEAVRTRIRQGPPRVTASAKDAGMRGSR